jgi:hypothetical protein
MIKVGRMTNIYFVTVLGHEVKIWSRNKDTDWMPKFEDMRRLVNRSRPNDRLGIMLPC